MLAINKGFEMFRRLKKLFSSKKKQPPIKYPVRESKKKERHTQDQSKKQGVNKSKVTSKTPSDTEQSSLILYKFDACPYCRRVQKVIAQLKIGEQIEMRDTRQNSKWRTDLQAKTGRTQVPCLFIDDEPMFESMDIINYLQMNFD